MFKYFGKYFWKFGKPYGLEKQDPTTSQATYKIVVDPYYKRISIEKYQFAQFEKTIYDSLLLDFRHLTLQNQNAWHRQILEEEENKTICLLRNQEDRAVLVETLIFENSLCRSCTTSSIHGIPLAMHRMYYQSMKDPFDGVILFDIEGRPVMIKKYERDEETGEFTNILSEEWNMQTPAKELESEIGSWQS
jgi:hypothetical protein